MIHGALALICRGEARRFARALSSPEATQRARLASILREAARAPRGGALDLGSGVSYETYRDRVPPSTDEDWQPLIRAQRASGSRLLNRRVTRYEATSGSTGARKWIPYTPAFLAEINAAARAWLHDLYAARPALRGGRHYWSLSWVPTELREHVHADDAALFPRAQRLILDRVLLNDPAVAGAPSSPAAWWATKLALAAAVDLRVLSTWSPTFALNAIEEIFADRAEITAALRAGRWGRHEDELARFTAPRRRNVPDPAHVSELARAFWPDLAVVSAWGAADSAPYAARLRALTASAEFQAKGLWATEGVITFPWRGRHPLAVRSHFYEFRCLTTGRVHPAWDLEDGQEVQPILTTGSAILRLALADRVRVNGFCGRTPCLDFVGRLGGVDLVGEKLSYRRAADVRDELNRRFPAATVHHLAAVVGRRPHYAALATGAGDASAVATALERALARAHHYRVARELGQLGPARCELLPGEAALARRLDRRHVRGQGKPAAIVRVNEDASAPHGREYD